MNAWWGRASSSLGLPERDPTGDSASASPTSPGLAERGYIAEPKLDGPKGIWDALMGNLGNLPRGAPVALVRYTVRGSGGE